MTKRLRKLLERYRHTDAAILYLRLFIGSVLLLHNIGKMQTYNEIIDDYPSLLFISNRASFALLAAAQTFLAVLLMIGVGVRRAAALLALGFAVDQLRGGYPHFDEVKFLWIGIFVFLWIAGGGAYAPEAALHHGTSTHNDNPSHTEQK